MNENENRKQPSAAQGVSIFFTLIVIVAVGFFIVKGIQASKNPEPEVTTETTEQIPSDENLTDSTEGDAVSDDKQNTQVTKEYFCNSEDFIFPEISAWGEVCSVTVISNNENVSGISINTSSGNELRTYNSLRDYDVLCEEDVFFPEVYSYTFAALIDDEDDIPCKELLMLKEMDDSHVVISNVNLIYQFDDYSKIQTSDGIKYQTSDGSRYNSLLNVPHTVEIEENGEAVTLYSEIEIK